MCNKVRKGKKGGKLDRARIDPAPVTKTWWKHSLKGSLSELLRQYPHAISPETQKIQKLCALKATSGKGQTEFPGLLNPGDLYTLLSHSALTSDTSRIPADDALRCNQQCYSLKQPDDLRFPNLIESPWKLGTLKSRHFWKCLLIS